MAKMAGGPLLSRSRMKNGRNACSMWELAQPMEKCRWKRQRLARGKIQYILDASTEALAATRELELVPETNHCQEYGDKVGKRTDPVEFLQTHTFRAGPCHKPPTADYAPVLSIVPTGRERGIFDPTTSQSFVQALFPANCFAATV